MVFNTALLFKQLHCNIASSSYILKIIKSINVISITFVMPKHSTGEKENNTFSPLSIYMVCKH